MKNTKLLGSLRQAQGRLFAEFTLSGMPGPFRCAQGDMRRAQDYREAVHGTSFGKKPTTERTVAARKASRMVAQIAVAPAATQAGFGDGNIAAAIYEGGS